MKVISIFCLLLPMLVLAQYEPHAIWTREGAGDSSLYGSSILALGDQNDDGYNDWAVYAHGWGGPGQVNEPKVEFFHGGNPPSTEPYMVRLTQTPVEEYLWGAKALGDLNGDGYTDWAILVELTEDTLGRDIYKIYFGGPGSHEEPDLVLTAPWQATYRSIGDFNGDGFADLFFSSGSGAVLYGGNPMDTVIDWTRNADLGGVFPGNANGDRFSDFLSIATDDNIDLFLGGEHPDTLAAYHWDEYVSMVAILPDLSGDGIGDLAFGVASHLEIRFGGSAIHATPDVILNFPCSSPHTIVSAGDFNRDGYHDIAMATDYCSDSWYGKLSLHLGGSWLNPEPAFIVYGWTEPLNLIGIRTACNLGDVNGDSVDDLCVGANDDVPHDGWRGKAVVLAGDTSLHVAADDPRPELPHDLQVNVYPNPFNSSCTVALTLPYNSDKVDLRLYNVLGQEVYFSVLQNFSGQRIHQIDASSLSTGLYLLHVSAGNLQSTTKLMLLR